MNTERVLRSPPDSLILFQSNLWETTHSAVYQVVSEVYLLRIMHSLQLLSFSPGMIWGMMHGATHKEGLAVTSYGSSKTLYW